MILLILAPAILIGGIVYLCSLVCCPGIAGQMRRFRSRPVDENRVDIGFFREFYSGKSWQQMLLYIFKNNKIVFKKDDFKDHYGNEMKKMPEEEQKEALNTENNMEELKVGILDDQKHIRNESTNLEVPPGRLRDESCELASETDNRISSVFTMKSKLDAGQKKSMKEIILETEKRK